MLLDTLKDDGTYFKGTLQECLLEAKKQTNLSIKFSYKTILRRERQNVDCYVNVTREPVNNWRMYSGRQIRAIVDYEIARASRTQK